MARCLAPEPCNYKLNGEVHDFGCPQRRGYYPDPELDELYATETANERECLDVILEMLLDEAGLSGNHEPTDVNGGDAEWLAIRRAIRTAHRHADLAGLARGFRVQLAADDGDSWPELHITDTQEDR